MLHAHAEPSFPPTISSPESTTPMHHPLRERVNCLGRVCPPPGRSRSAATKGRSFHTGDYPCVAVHSDGPASQVTVPAFRDPQARRLQGQTFSSPRPCPPLERVGPAYRHRGQSRELHQRGSPTVPLTSQTKCSSTSLNPMPMSTSPAIGLSQLMRSTSEAPITVKQRRHRAARSTP